MASLTTVKVLALSAVGLAAIVAVVVVGFWRRRQLDADRKGHGEHNWDLWGPDAEQFPVRGERAEQDAYRGDGSYNYGEFAGGDVHDEA